MEHKVVIENGHVKFVYDDALGDLLDEGEAAVCRVSHVEPHPFLQGTWLADMRPVDGPVIAANGEFAVGPKGEFGEDPLFPFLGRMEGFKTRAEALAAERCWLTKEKGL